MGKNIRFAELVKTSGQPEVATLWQDPETDPQFKVAMRQNRILTVRQETVGSKKDYGEIGFLKERNVSYLIFPKPLPKSTDARVIGIKYGMIEAGPVVDPVSKKELAANKKKAVKQQPKASQKPTKPVQEKFIVTVRKTAAWETTLKVTAKTITEAEEQAVKLARTESLPMSDAIVEIQVRKVSRG